MNKRINRTIRLLKNRAFLFTSKSDIFYLTGVELEGFWLLVEKEGAAAIAPKMLAGQLGKLLTGIEVLGGNDLIGLLAERLKKKGARMLSVNGSALSHGLFSKLNRKIKVKDEVDVLAGLRLIKDPGELQALRKSCKIAVSALRYAKRFIKPGVSEEQIAFKIESYFLDNHVRPSFPLIVASGLNSSNPHHLSSSRKIKPNDVILIDMGCVYKGYCSDLTRTFFLGKTNGLQKTVYLAVKQAHAAAMAMVRPGARADLVDKAARDVIEKAGFGGKFIHSTGHGVGIDIHESPRLSEKDKTVLKPGMAVTVEPGVYLEGDFGVRIEDTVVVTTKGREVLT